MKILIITYYKETNPGTFLQAYAVQYSLHIRFPHAQITYLNYTKNIKECGSVSPSNIPSMSFMHKVKHIIALKYRNKLFQQAQKKNFNQGKIKFDLYPTAEQESLFIDYANQFDYVVIGSDTILESLEINNNIGVMWPSTAIKAKKIYFAASADSAKNIYQKTHLFENIKTRIVDFAQIGLRDNVTLSLFEKNIGVPKHLLIKQADPTIFLPLNIFQISSSKTAKLPKHGKVIFYHFDRRFKYREILANLLKAKGYYLITTEYDPNCNHSFRALTPFEWGAIFRHCNYVLTERFHDTIFSMRHGVPVITVDWNMDVLNINGESKRLSILKDFDCQENYISISTEDDLDLILKKISSQDTTKFKKKTDMILKDMEQQAYTTLYQI